MIRQDDGDGDDVRIRVVEDNNLRRNLNTKAQEWRVAIHAYQGQMALVGITPMAVVFTCYFARTGRLWPVVVAHAIGDAAGLGPLFR